MLVPTWLGPTPVEPDAGFRGTLDEQRHGFGDIELRVLNHSERPVRADVEHPFVQATISALRDVYGRDPVAYPNSAGSGPMHPFVGVLGIPVGGLGVGYPGSRLHAPNENIREQDFHPGVAALVRLFERYV